MKIPPPPKWDSKIDGLEEAWKWGADYERSLLPSHIVFPRAGQIWEAVCDCDVNFIGFIPKTILPGGRAQLQQGERVRIRHGVGEPGRQLHHGRKGVDERTTRF